MKVTSWKWKVAILIMNFKLPPTMYQISLNLNQMSIYYISDVDFLWLNAICVKLGEEKINEMQDKGQFESNLK